jgi:hypothetical protein
MSETSHQGGDQIDIGGATITLCRRKGSTGIRWTWAIPSTDLMGEIYHATPEAAIAHARKTMNSPECAHGGRGFCPTCHDASNR